MAEVESGEAPRVDEFDTREVRRYEAMRGSRKCKRRSVFATAGDAKRNARELVYRHVAGLLPSANRFLILPGRSPGHEVALIRSLFAQSEIVALDVDQEAVDAARQAGVDAAARVDVGDLRLKGCYVSPGVLISPYDFINLDFCGLVNSSGVAHAVERASRLTGTFATWFSYGHEKNLPHIVDRARHVSVCGGPWVQQCMSGVKKKIVDRLLFIWTEAVLASPGPFPLHIPHRVSAVWYYRDKKMPMMVALWTTEPPKRVPFFRGIDVLERV